MFAKFRSALTLVKDLKPLIAADKLAGRALLYCLKLEELPEAILSDAAHPSVFVTALEQKLQGMPLSGRMDRGKVRFNRWMKATAFQLSLA